MTKKQRIAKLVDLLNAHEDKVKGNWACKDHNAGGTWGTRRVCCEEEYYKLTKKQWKPHYKQ